MALNARSKHKSILMKSPSSVKTAKKGIFHFKNQTMDFLNNSILSSNSSQDNLENNKINCGEKEISFIENNLNMFESNLNYFRGISRNIKALSTNKISNFETKTKNLNNSENDFFSVSNDNYWKTFKNSSFEASINEKKETEVKDRKLSSFFDTSEIYKLYSSVENKEKKSTKTADNFCLSPRTNSFNIPEENAFYKQGCPHFSKDVFEPRKQEKQNLTFSFELNFKDSNERNSLNSYVNENQQFTKRYEKFINHDQLKSKQESIYTKNSLHFLHPEILIRDYRKKESTTFFDNLQEGVKKSQKLCDQDFSFDYFQKNTGKIFQDDLLKDSMVKKKDIHYKNLPRDFNINKSSSCITKNQMIDQSSEKSTFLNPFKEEKKILFLKEENIIKNVYSKKQKNYKKSIPLSITSHPFQSFHEGSINNNYKLNQLQNNKKLCTNPCSCFSRLNEKSLVNNQKQKCSNCLLSHDKIHNFNDHIFVSKNLNFENNKLILLKSSKMTSKLQKFEAVNDISSLKNKIIRHIKEDLQNKHRKLSKCNEINENNLKNKIEKNLKNSLEIKIEKNDLKNNLEIKIKNKIENNRENDLKNNLKNNEKNDHKNKIENNLEDKINNNLEIKIENNEKNDVKNNLEILQRSIKREYLFPNDRKTEIKNSDFRIKKLQNFEQKIIENLKINSKTEFLLKDERKNKTKNFIKKKETISTFENKESEDLKNEKNIKEGKIDQKYLLCGLQLNKKNNYLPFLKIKNISPEYCISEESLIRSDKTNKQKNIEKGILKEFSNLYSPSTFEKTTYLKKLEKESKLTTNISPLKTNSHKKRENETKEEIISPKNLRKNIDLLQFENSETNNKKNYIIKQNVKNSLLKQNLDYTQINKSNNFKEGFRFLNKKNINILNSELNKSKFPNNLDFKYKNIFSTNLLDFDKSEINHKLKCFNFNEKHSKLDSKLEKTLFNKEKKYIRQNIFPYKKMTDGSNSEDTHLFMHFVRSLRNLAEKNDVFSRSNLENGGGAYECGFCNMKYIYKRCLANHIRKKHHHQRK